MPKFELVSRDDAMMKSATGKRVQIMKEYMSYVQQLREGQAGKLRAAEGEKVAAIRRRLGIAARLAGKALTIKRVEDEIYFWVKSQGEGSPRRRGSRPRKAGTAAP